MSKFWGSRFNKGTDALADKFSFSIGYDWRLAKYDVRASIAHARMLGKCGIIPRKDAARIAAGLTKIGRQIEQGKFSFDPKAEDVHTNIQSALKKLIGPAADKLHTARSRNDLIVLDMKLYCLDKLNEIIAAITAWQKAIVGFADKNKDVIIPAYTHLQSAQVVLLAHHMLAYVEMLERDKARLYGTLKRTGRMPLGSCALSGTTLPIDRNFVAKQLGFAKVTANSIDSVSDRDFVIEALSDLAILGMHCSRVAEDVILWATREFNFVDIDWSLCTGSSIMPHKKNPDILELIRGETAKLYSHLNEVLVLMKGLPLTYNRDMQLDKPPLFGSVEKIKDMLGLLTKLFAGLKVKEKAIAGRIHDETFFSVDIMEYLIKKGVSYRQAHDTVGTMIKECVDNGRKIADLTLAELKGYSPSFGADVKALLDPKVSVSNKKSLGSTNPALVLREIERWKKIVTLATGGFARGY
ncbi:MAG: argininosuccinate lyase [Candidatus Omnitrophica bacterium]|nr:argininosuccinate lyase [Candidatus Omnitrophota bacterium]